MESWSPTDLRGRTSRIAQSAQDSATIGEISHLQAAANTYRITIRIYSLNGDDLVLLPDGHERSTDLREIHA